MPSGRHNVISTGSPIIYDQGIAGSEKAKSTGKALSFCRANNERFSS